jgi:hypothetical protein
MAPAGGEMPDLNLLLVSRGIMRGNMQCAWLLRH